MKIWNIEYNLVYDPDIFMCFLLSRIPHTECLGLQKVEFFEFFPIKLRPKTDIFKKLLFFLGW